MTNIERIQTIQQWLREMLRNRIITSFQKISDKKWVISFGEEKIEDESNNMLKDILEQYQKNYITLTEFYNLAFEEGRKEEQKEILEKTRNQKKCTNCGKDNDRMFDLCFNCMENE